MGNKISKIYVGTNLVRPVQEPPYTPTANTVAYFPFTNDKLDQTGNITLSNNRTQDGLGFRPTTNGNGVFTASHPALYYNMWICIKDFGGGVVGFGGNCYIANNTAIPGYYVHHYNSSLDRKFFVRKGGNFDVGGTASRQPTTNTRHNVSFGWNGTTAFYSVDGVRGTLYTGSGYSEEAKDFFFDAGSYIISNLIIEDTVWSTTKETNYYNQTKSIYGL